MRKRWISGSVVLALAIWPAAAMATPSYTAVFLPGNGAPNTYATGIASNGQIVGYSTAGPDDALLWTSPSASPAILTPSGDTDGLLKSTDGITEGGQVGVGEEDHAAIWQGNTGSFVDLNPSGDQVSIVHSVSGSQEVGAGINSTTPLHALLWYGTAASVVDLNPAGYQSSEAHGTNGNQQVGFGTTVINNMPSGPQALLWNGTAASAQNITPAAYSNAEAWAISGNLVAGSGDRDALLWDLSNGTYTDLGPGIAYAVTGEYEVGYRSVGSNHAVVWEGSAASAVDLNNYLPPGYASIAYGVNAEGDVVGVASTSNGYYAVEWIAPEPATFITSMLFLSLVKRHARRRA